MQKARHCLICENQVIDYQKGTLCGLSMHKPAFNEKCREIEFGKKYEQRLEQVTEEFENLRKENFFIYSYFIVFTLIGLAVIGGGLAFGSHYVQYLGDSRFVIAVPVLIIAGGIALLLKSISTLSKHVSELKIARSYKQELDDLNALYRR